MQLWRDRRVLGSCTEVGGYWSAVVMWEGVGQLFHDSPFHC